MSYLSATVVGATIYVAGGKTDDDGRRRASMLNYARQIAVGRHYDLVVCGGGPSGCAAALSAAREGLSVLVVEGRGQLGGTATSGLVSHWLGGRTEDGEWVIGGLFRALSEGAARSGYAVIPENHRNETYQPYGWLPWFIHGIPLDPHGIARYLDVCVRKAGVDVLLDTQAVDVQLNGTRISHIVTFNKSGLGAVPCDAVVDATGDADIASRSGCVCRTGRPEDGLMTPASLCFHVYGVDHDELSRVINRDRTPKFRDKIAQLRRDGIWPFPYDIFISIQLVDETTAMINTSRLVGIDGTDGVSVSEGYVRGRQETEALLGLLRDHFPGFRNARIKEVAHMLGIRETRRIKGRYELSIADLQNGAAFDDTVGFSVYGWDLPDPKRPSVQPLVDESGRGYDNKVSKSLSSPIPYRIMVPVPIENLLCTGRCVSVERDVLGPLRVMAPAMAMGEAAGAAAALALRGKTAFADTSTDTLRSLLRTHGCIVDRESLPAIRPRIDP